MTSGGPTTAIRELLKANPSKIRDASDDKIGGHVGAFTGSFQKANRITTRVARGLYLLDTLLLLPLEKKKKMDLKLPPGFRFHPTDEELVVHYLCRKCAAHPISPSIIADFDIYKSDPWDLPGVSLHGEREWYFFSPRDRKYPNGSRPNRSAGSGYWKATGADKPVGSPKPVGIKKALVFYSGKAPKGEKTNWIMHEYRLADVDRSIRRKNSLRLDDWVLCRIYNKKGSAKVEVKEKKETVSEYVYMEGESAPRLRAESSCSEQALSSEFAWDEVQSQPKWKAWENDDGFSQLGPLSSLFRDPPLPDLLMYLQKPF